VQPLTLTIPGEYWDSQIYSGRLYLFGRSGDIRTVDWDRLIGEWRIEEELRLPMACAFRRSDYLYGDQWSLLFSDEEVRTLITRKFESLSARNLEVSKEELLRLSIRHQKNPFPFPHADSIIYNKDMFVASQSGVYRATCRKSNVNPVSSRVEKKWDAPTLGVDASYWTLALAAGDEGLFEMPVVEENGYHSGSREAPHRVADENCADCNWAFYSIYGSSHAGAGFLADYEKQPIANDRQWSRRVLQGVISAEKIFGNGRGYSWGAQDKLCLVTGSTIHVMSYRPWEKSTPDRLQGLGAIDVAVNGDPQTVQLAPWKGDVISGAVALFGMVIECDNAIVVIPSEGAAITLPGEPINWRAFPKSVQYENQLHVIYEDRLEILSFNHDYFVNQDLKLSGIRHLGSTPRHRRRPAPLDSITEDVD
jgi:hypothetical protein